MFGLNNKEKTVIKEIYICLQNEKKNVWICFVEPQNQQKTDNTVFIRKNILNLQKKITIIMDN